MYVDLFYTSEWTQSFCKSIGQGVIVTLQPAGVIHIPTWNIWLICMSCGWSLSCLCCNSNPPNPVQTHDLHHPLPLESTDSTALPIRPVRLNGLDLTRHTLIIHIITALQIELTHQSPHHLMFKTVDHLNPHFLPKHMLSTEHRGLQHPTKAGKALKCGYICSVFVISDIIDGSFVSNISCQVLWCLPLCVRDFWQWFYNAV